MKKKIKLSAISVTSFVTINTDALMKIRGGDPLNTKIRCASQLECGSQIDACITAQACTISFPGLC